MPSVGDKRSNRLATRLDDLAARPEIAKAIAAVFLTRCLDGSGGSSDFGSLRSRLRARAGTRLPPWPPMHPAGLRCSSALRGNVSKVGTPLTEKTSGAMVDRMLKCATITHSACVPVPREQLGVA